MSEDAVTFHYVTPGEMYMFDFLLYRLKRYRRSTLTSNNHSDHIGNATRRLSTAYNAQNITNTSQNSTNTSTSTVKTWKQLSRYCEDRDHRVSTSASSPGRLNSLAFYLLRKPSDGTWIFLLVRYLIHRARFTSVGTWPMFLSLSLSAV